MTPEEKKAWACAQLCQTAERLGRIPKKEDLDAVTLSRVKAYLGPWPRALEAAGLKEAKPVPTKSKKRKAAAVKTKQRSARKPADLPPQSPLKEDPT